jgi:hypothetical protein
MGRASRAARCRRIEISLGMVLRNRADWLKRLAEDNVVGAKGQTRTADRTIFSRELYQLSYLGAGLGPGRWAIEGSNL